MNANCKIGLGTAAIGRPLYINIREVSTEDSFNINEFRQKGIDILNSAYAQGVRYFDTAPGYGMAEQMLIDWIQEKKDGTIEIAPLAYMRGRTLDHAFAILDEAQNATQNQLKMFLTRMGKTAKFIVTGDITQVDLPKKNQSGLIQATKILKNIPSIEIIFLDDKDIVRHPLVGKIIKAYNKEELQIEMKTKPDGQKK